jgi:hypothetical protein
MRSTGSLAIFFHREIEQLAGTGIGPMQILEDHQWGLLASQTAELSQ